MLGAVQTSQRALAHKSLHPPALPVHPLTVRWTKHATLLPSSPTHSSYPEALWARTQKPAGSIPTPAPQRKKVSCWDTAEWGSPGDGSESRATYPLPTHITIVIESLPEPCHICSSAWQVIQVSQDHYCAFHSWAVLVSTHTPSRQMSLSKRKPCSVVLWVFFNVFSICFLIFYSHLIAFPQPRVRAEVQ